MIDVWQRTKTYTKSSILPCNLSHVRILIGAHETRGARKSIELSLSMLISRLKWTTPTFLIDFEIFTLLEWYLMEKVLVLARMEEFLLRGHICCKGNSFHFSRRCEKRGIWGNKESFSYWVYSKWLPQSSKHCSFLRSVQSWWSLVIMHLSKFCPTYPMRAMWGNRRGFDLLYC